MLNKVIIEFTLDLNACNLTFNHGGKDINPRDFLPQRELILWIVARE